MGVGVGRGGGAAGAVGLRLDGEAGRGDGVVGVEGLRAGGAGKGGRLHARTRGPVHTSTL